MNNYCDGKEKGSIFAIINVKFCLMSQSKLRKILIISYFYPPCSLTASQRPANWAHELHKHGYFPIVVTRKWERPIKVYADEGFGTSSGVEIEQNENYEVIRTAYKPKLRDKIYIKFGANRFSLIRRLLSAFNLITRNLHPSFSPFYPLLIEAEKVIALHKPEALIITGNPFNQFYFGYLLNKKFGIPWIADYRDAWTTSQIKGGLPKAFTIFTVMNSYFEKKWCGSAEFVCSVSEPLAKKIATLTNRPYLVLPNGYADNLFAAVGFPEQFKQFTVTYLGSLYPNQNIELFLESYLIFLKNNNLSNEDSKLLFPGLALMPDQNKRIVGFSEKLLPYIETTERLPQLEVLKIQRQSHLLLYVGWKGYEGVVPSKIFEYCASGTPIIVTPADHSEVDKIVKEAKVGICTNDVEDTVAAIQQFYEAFKKGKPIKNNAESKEIEALSASAKGKELASFFDTILTKG